jgi:hypothetical protein
MEFQNCKGYLIALMSLHLNGLNNEKDGIENFHNLSYVFPLEATIVFLRIYFSLKLLGIPGYTLSRASLSLGTVS